MCCELVELAVSYLRGGYAEVPYFPQMFVSVQCHAFVLGYFQDVSIMLFCSVWHVVLFITPPVFIFECYLSS